MSLLLFEELEGALLGNVAERTQTLDGLHALGVLLLGHDTTSLGLHQVLLGQATGCVLGRFMVNLSLGADSGNLLDFASLGHFY